MSLVHLGLKIFNLLFFQNSCFTQQLGLILVLHKANSFFCFLLFNRIGNISGSWSCEMHTFWRLGEFVNLTGRSAAHRFVVGPMAYKIVLLV